MKNIHVVMACLIICLITAGCGGGGGGSSSDRQFNLVVLDSIEGSGVAINNRGQVLIDGRDPDAVWEYAQGESGVRMLPGTTNTTVSDINDLGQVVGSDDTRGFVIEPSGTKRVLSPVDGDPDSSARNINNAGQIVGCSGYHHDMPYLIMGMPVIWDVNESVRELDVLPGYEEGLHFNINDSGVVVGDAVSGYSSLPGGSSEPYSYYPARWERDGRMTILRTPGNSCGRAVAVNSSGFTVGYWYVTGTVGGRAVVWTPDGSVRNLYPLSGFDSSIPADINDDRWVVGYCANDNEDEFEFLPHAVCWTPDGRVIDLGKSHRSSWVSSVNQDGVIAGWVEGADGKRHPAVWVPVI